MYHIIVIVYFTDKNVHKNYTVNNNIAFQSKTDHPQTGYADIFLAPALTRWP